MTSSPTDSTVLAPSTELLREVQRLPKCDYFNRRVEDNTIEQQEINKIILVLQTKLQTMLTKETGKNFVNIDDEQLNKYIAEFEKLSKRESDATLSLQYKSYAVVAKDLLKISQLKALNIPDEQQRVTDSYFSLADATEGATEKVSLISKATVHTQLNNLLTAGTLSFGEYYAQRSNYQLRTEAIIKRPKHGEAREVQREAIALNISRILGLDTTRSTMILHNGEPSLFVPFDRIKPLREYAAGQQFTALETRQTYEHYSTINPSGEGLESNRSVDDFGQAFSLMYLCSDTDCIGGYNQNKALRNDKSLYIFDQVVMPDDKFKLDSRLSLKPNQTLAKHTRHGQGRNRTLIEDSSLVEKYQSLMSLTDNKDKILLYLDHVAQQYETQCRIQAVEIGQLKKQGASAKTIETYDNGIKVIERLLADVKTLKSTITKRIDAIKTIFPERDENLPESAKLQAITLEKLVNRPVLFTEQGRPYKNPWTNLNKVTVASVNLTRERTVEITFNGDVPIDTIRSLSSPQRIPSLKITSKTMLMGAVKKIELRLDDFLALRENMLHPEHNTTLQKDFNYLNHTDLNELAESYQTKYKDIVFKNIIEYQRVMQNASVKPTDKLDKILETQSKLKSYLDEAQRNNYSQGLVKHVLKKFQFDVQCQLQLLVPKELHTDLDNAFTAALKLDRVELLNRVLIKAIQNNRVGSVEFHQFLQSCIAKAAQAGNYAQAQQQSDAVKQDGEQCLRQISSARPIHTAFEDDDLLAFNLISTREQELSMQQEVRPQLPQQSVVPVATSNTDEGPQPVRLMT